MKEMMVAKDAREVQGGGFVRQEHSPQIGRGFTTKNPLIRMNINPKVSNVVEYARTAKAARHKRL